MRAVRSNQEYFVTEETKEAYLKDGFDIYDDDGKLLEHGKGRRVSQQDYEKVCMELQEAKKGTLAESELIPILKEYAAMKGIDTGQASSVRGIYGKIKDAVKAEED